MKELVIIEPRQFGYHTDAYQVSLKLCDKFQVKMVCFDSGEPKYASDRVNVIYVPRREGSFERASTFANCQEGVKRQCGNRLYLLLPAVFLLDIELAKDIFRHKNWRGSRQKAVPIQIQCIVTF